MRQALIVLKILGILLIIFSSTLLPPMAISWFVHDGALQAFAIAYALGSPALEVLGVVSVQDTVASGPDSVDVYVAEARKVADLCGRPDVPSLAGARTPMETPTSPVRCRPSGETCADPRPPRPRRDPS